MRTTYEFELHRLRSILIATALQERRDVRARETIERFAGSIEWNGPELRIDKDAWNHVVNTLNCDPKLVFCHPAILLAYPTTSLYYRGLAGLSIKAAKSYVGSIENLEAGNPRAKLDRDKALRMAQTYNDFISAIIKGLLPEWSLEDGYRTIIANIGITLDGTMRNRIGEMAELEIRKMVLIWLIQQGLLEAPQLSLDEVEAYSSGVHMFLLQGDLEMGFGSEPDISFQRGEDILAVVEVKGGTDPAGALERYGAARKSFEHAMRTTARCKNFYLVAVLTPEVERRIQADRLVERVFNIVDILDDIETRNDFFAELFHHTLRVI